MLAYYSDITQVPRERKLLQALLTISFFVDSSFLHPTNKNVVIVNKDIKNNLFGFIISNFG